MSTILKIPFQELPQGITLCIKNAQRHQKDAEILASAQRFSSSIVSLILSIEEFGKALWLTEHFVNYKSVNHLHKWNSPFFSHRKKMDNFFEFLDNVPNYTRKSGTNRFVNLSKTIGDDQEYKLRMLYVDYITTVNDRYFDSENWKDPTFIWQLAFVGETDENIALKTKINEFQEDLKVGLEYFCNSDVYDAITQFSKKSEKPNTHSVTTFLYLHFLLSNIQLSVGVGNKKITVILQPTKKNIDWVKSIIKIAEEELKTKYPQYEIDVDLIPKKFKEPKP